MVYDNILLIMKFQFIMSWWEIWHFQKFWYTQLFLVRERKNHLCYSIWPISFYEKLCGFSGFLNSRIVRLMSLSQNYERRDTTAVKYFDDSLREIIRNVRRVGSRKKSLTVTLKYHNPKMRFLQTLKAKMIYTCIWQKN